PLAVPGYTSHQGLIWFRHELRRLRPDIVTVLFGWNDTDLRLAPDHETLPTSPPRILARRAIDASQLLTRLALWSHRPSATPTNSSGVPRVPRDRFVANHRQIARLGHEAGARVVWIAPVYRDLETHPDHARRIAEWRAALAEAAPASDPPVPFLLVPELTEAAYPENAPLYGEAIHPGHLGHALLAQRLFEFIRENGWVGD